MKEIAFTREEEFTIENADCLKGFYFPIAGEGRNGLKSCFTPKLCGDAKVDQNSFLLQPASIEDLSEQRASRNIWFVGRNGDVLSLTGVSDEQTLNLVKHAGREKCTLSAGYMWMNTKRVFKRTAEGTSFLCSDITCFIPKDIPYAECIRVCVKNTGNADETFTVISAIPLYGRSADNIRDHRHVTSLLHRVKHDEAGLVLHPALSFDERGHLVNEREYFCFACDENGNYPSAVISSVSDFTGECGTYTAPAAVYEIYNGKTDVWEKAGPADGRETVAAFRFPEITLKPGENKTYIIMSGTGMQEDTGFAKKYLCNNASDCFESSLETTKKYWKSKVNITVNTGNKRFDAFMRWVAFQPVLRSIYGCSFLPHHDYGRGGRGWRDLWQDCVALLLMDPGDVRFRLLNNYKGVRTDGTNATIICETPGEFKADRNGIPRVWMDHGFWPVFTTDMYIETTGDIRFLLEETTYFEDGLRRRSELRTEACYGKPIKGTVLEHMLIMTVTEIMDVGEHGNIRLRGADWNDAIDMASKNGESVAFTHAYAGALELIAGMLRKLDAAGIHEVDINAWILELIETVLEKCHTASEKKAALLQYYKDVETEPNRKISEVSSLRVAGMLENICSDIRKELRENEWLQGENSFFNGYYDNNSRRVENNTEDVRMMLTSQVFAIMYGTATPEMTSEIIKSADKYLFRPGLGYALNTDFKELKHDLGRMFGFAYGNKENGSVFSHMAVMYAYALMKAGLKKEGFKGLYELFRASDNTEKSQIFPGIPEYFESDGRGVYHYLTGAASWYVLTVFRYVFGIEYSDGNLVIKPYIPEELFGNENEVSIDFVYCGKKVRIVVVGNENGGPAEKYPDYRSLPKLITVTQKDAEVFTEDVNILTLGNNTGTKEE